MPDTQIHPLGDEAAPAAYVIPKSAELLLKGVFARFDGSGAAGPFVPLMRLISDAGTVSLEAPADQSVAAGASVDASWFPRVGGAAASAAGGDGLQYNSGTYGPDNEGDWFFAAVNDPAGGPNGYGWQFDTGISALPFAVTGDGGFTVVTQVVSVEADSGFTVTAGAGSILNVAAEGTAFLQIGNPAAPGNKDFEVRDHNGAVLFQWNEDGTAIGGTFLAGTTVDGGSA